MSSAHNKRIRFFIIIFLITTSSLGMALCASVRFLFYDTNNEMLSNSFWFLFIIISISLYMIALIILVPVEILIFSRKERKGKTFKNLSLSDLLGLPFGLVNADTKVPSWIKYPVLFFLFLLIGIFALAVLGSSIVYFIKLFHG